MTWQLDKYAYIYLQLQVGRVDARWRARSERAFKSSIKIKNM